MNRVRKSGCSRVFLKDLNQLHIMDDINGIHIPYNGKYVYQWRISISENSNVDFDSIYLFFRGGELLWIAFVKGKWWEITY